MVEEESEEEQGAAAVEEPMAEDEGGNENDGEGEDDSDGGDEQGSEEETDDDDQEEEAEQQQQGVSQKRRAVKTRGGPGTKQGDKGRGNTSGKTVALTKKNVLPPLQVRNEFSGNTALLGMANSFVIVCCLNKLACIYKYDNMQSYVYDAILKLISFLLRSVAAKVATGHC